MRMEDIHTIANNVLGSIHKRVEFLDAQFEDPDAKVDVQTLCDIESLAAYLKGEAEILESLILAIRRAQ